MIIATYTEPDEPTIYRISYVEGLIRNSTFDHDTQAQMERGLITMAEGELLDLELRLLPNQLHPIFERGNYSLTDVKNMKNIFDPAQFSDYERAAIDKGKFKKLKHYGDTTGMIMLHIRRNNLIVFFKTMADLERKRGRYEIEEFEGKIIMA